MKPLLLLLALAASGIKFDDATQSYAGERYKYLGDGPIKLTIPVAPQPGHVLALKWGSKNDQRAARVRINGKSVDVTGGGYDGFRWLAVPMPDGVTGDRCEVTLEKAPAGKPAFLSAVQVTTKDKVPVTLEPAKPVEAFPEMRTIWDREPANPSLAEHNARQAAEAFYRCRKFVAGWLARADPKTGLIPRNFRGSDYWNGRDAAADNYPFMVLTAAMTDRALFEGRMLEMLRTEIKLTCRVDRLPEDWSFATQAWRREKVDLDALIFEGAEYVKDGLLPITEWLGASPWSERAIGIVDDIWKNATVETPFGKIPTLNFEVNGDLLQACSRLYWFTGERKYLDWAIRLGDYYLLGNQHPTRDIAELKLGDHSCEVINGLSELYVACHYAAPEKKKAYEKPLRELYDHLLKVARNEHGLVYLKVNNRTGEHTTALTDNWGYNYDGLYTVYLLDGTTAYRDAVRKALSNLKEHYTGQGGMCQSNTADGYADSIEGAITLLNREPIASAFEWVDTEIKTMWAKQQPDGVIEGWHGDGNSARTSLMYALWKTQGCTVEPWRPDVRVGAARDGDKLLISLTADQPWTGKLIFDRPRHKTNMRLPLDYPRINQFPEWFTVEAGKRYTVGNRTFTGNELAAGIPITLKSGQELQLCVQ
ncbi:MAG: hypothetical protein FJ395_09020 [Verrucomicrobia bacterium]|nr:hypothetical protein [Verrucomicrobiota bacterium]